MKMDFPVISFPSSLFLDKKVELLKIIFFSNTKFNFKKIGTKSRLNKARLHKKNWLLQYFLISNTFSEKINLEPNFTLKYGALNCLTNVELKNKDISELKC